MLTQLYMLSYHQDLGHGSLCLCYNICAMCWNQQILVGRVFSMIKYCQLIFATNWFMWLVFTTGFMEPAFSPRYICQIECIVCYL